MNEIIVTQQNGKIEANFAEVESYIKGTLEEYKGAQFTEDSKTFGKQIVASLRKDQTALKDRIKEVKKAWLAPFEEFKEQADKLVNLYDEPIDYINGQIKEMEEKRIADKKRLINELYRDIFMELTATYPLSSIYNPKWENATFTKNQVVTEMQEKRNKIIDDEQTIRSYTSDAVDKALEAYRYDLDLASAVQYIIRYEQQRTAILEQERQKEIERIRQEEREKLLAEQKAEAEKAQAVAEAQQEVIDSMVADDADAEKSPVIYSMELTNGQREALEMYLDSVGIDWEVLA